MWHAAGTPIIRAALAGGSPVACAGQFLRIGIPHNLAEFRPVIPADPATVSALIELLELAGRSMHSIGYADGLYPAQWTALRYFSKASDGTRTASALARFQGFANGPVSRTVRTLISKGLLRKAESQPAGRAEHLEITENARSLLEHDPARVIADTIAQLSEEEKAALDHALRAVIKSASGVWPRDGKGNGRKE